ncbi:MAG: hypothetical protein ACRDRZ_15800, partial [Pseudonocardiaceae bacterium]
GFVAQWHLPEVTWGQMTEDGETGIHLWAPDGSRASVRSTSTDSGFRVSQAGPRRLWDRVEEAVAFLWLEGVAATVTCQPSVTSAAACSGALWASGAAQTTRARE